MTQNPGTKHTAGGKVSIPLLPHVKGAAIFGGPADEYRYRLSRTWGPGKRILFVMMNPSTADPYVNDPTVAKCQKLAERWGYDGIDVGNTFAYRATDQSLLTQVADPVGPDNDRHLIAMAKSAALVVFAYGQPKSRPLRDRGIIVANLLRHHAGIQPHILRLTKDGTPGHPLYLPESLQPSPWNP